MWNDEQFSYHLSPIVSIYPETLMISLSVPPQDSLERQHCQAHASCYLYNFTDFPHVLVSFKTEPRIGWFLSITTLLVIFSVSERSSQILGKLFWVLMGL